MRRRVPLPLLIIMLVVLLATRLSAASAQTATPGITLPPGCTAQIIDSGFKLPTHLAYGPDGVLYVTQLNGGENDGTGQVVRVAQPGSPTQVMLDHLTKPTGLAWAGDDLYIVAGRDVQISHYQGGKLSDPQVLFKGLPFNGRSNGQIFLGPDGLLYFESTGTEAAPHDSGFICTSKPGSGTFNIFARGLKNAYAIAWNPHDGTMYATEIGDGAIPDVGQPPEKLNRIKAGANYGWPECYGMQKPNPT